MRNRAKTKLDRTFRALAFVVGFALAGLLSSCQKPPAVDPEVVARVGGHEIRAGELRAEMARRNRVSRVPVEAKEVLQEMINREALCAAAIAKGLDRDPEVRRAWKNLLVGKLKERELQPLLDSAQISEQELGEHYRQNIARYTKPAQARLALLRLRTDRLMSDEKRAALENQMMEARRAALGLDPQTRDFGPLAANYSDEQATRFKGGDIGWLDTDAAKYRWNSQALTAGFALRKTGEVSGVIHGEDGVYLVKLVDRREAEATPLKQIEPAARHQLLARKRQQIEKEFADQTRLAASVTIEEERMKMFTGSSLRKEASPADVAASKFAGLPGTKQE